MRRSRSPRLQLPIGLTARRWRAAHPLAPLLVAPSSLTASSLWAPLLPWDSTTLPPQSHPENVAALPPRLLPFQVGIWTFPQELLAPFSATGETRRTAGGGEPRHLYSSTAALLAP